MDRYFPVHTVRRAGPVRRLRTGVLLDVGLLTTYMRTEHLAGVLVLQQGTIRAEKYALGATPHTRWTSFSVTKAVTDSMAGAALQDGALHSFDDGVTRYLPEMLGSAYEGVTVRQLITMTSGVRWNENYVMRDADNIRLYSTRWPRGQDPVVEYMRRLPRAAPPGTRWLYNTGETDLLGVLLRRATGTTLADQLSETIWSRAGMERDATWIATSSTRGGEEFGGSGLSATLRDFGRLGLWVLEDGHGAVPPGWFAQATRGQVQAGTASYGYGWWPQANGSFAALGIFGQSILIDPKRQLVIVTLGDWAEATSAAHSAARAAFWGRIESSVDAD